ncbi:Uncharacterised protein [Mycobacterium tuberculosis]|nr:Uncharacterised protein [Mycobacterium tuberculosis]
MDMAAEDTSINGTNFWAALGTNPGTAEAPTAPAGQDKLVAGRGRNRPPESTGERAVQTPAREPSSGEDREPAPAPASAPPVSATKTKQPSAKEAGDRPKQPASRSSPQVTRHTTVQFPMPAVTRAAEGTAGPETSQPPAPEWPAAEEIAHSLGPRLFEIWTEVLTRHTGGDEAMARRVYDVLTGCHLLGELWRDEGIEEVHVQGTEVTVCGPNGMRQVAGFPDLATAQRAVETFRATQDAQGAVVSRVGSAVVVSRTSATGPTTAWLLARGVLTEGQLSQVAMALRDMRTVTVIGPAARIVVRALASLVPAGSRVFLGSYVALPAGCVTAASPMEADYVVGVRPGALAEDMAAEGQVGALIANPETRVRGVLRLAVSGPSANPGEISRIP